MTDQPPPSPRIRPPLVEAPIALSGATPAPETVRLVMEKAAPLGKLAGLMGATALGVTAAYFGPRFWDWALERWRERDELELDDYGEG